MVGHLHRQNMMTFVTQYTEVSETSRETQVQVNKRSKVPQVKSGLLNQVSEAPQVKSGLFKRKKMMYLPMARRHCLARRHILLLLEFIEHVTRTLERGHDAEGSNPSSADLKIDFLRSTLIRRPMSQFCSHRPRRIRTLLTSEKATILPTVKRRDVFRSINLLNSFAIDFFHSALSQQVRASPAVFGV